MLILKIVALGPVHGYGISLRIRQISKEVLQVQQGSLYPALHRLERRGWLDAEWGESENGRQAKFYKLSAKGRKQLAEEELNWQRLAGPVALIMRCRRPSSRMHSRTLADLLFPIRRTKRKDWKNASTTYPALRPFLAPA